MEEQWIYNIRQNLSAYMESKADWVTLTNHFDRDRTRFVLSKIANTIIKQDGSVIYGRISKEYLSIIIDEVKSSESAFASLGYPCGKYDAFGDINEFYVGEDQYKEDVKFWKNQREEFSNWLDEIADSLLRNLPDESTEQETRPGPKETFHEPAGTSFFGESCRIAAEMKTTDSEFYNSLLAHDYVSSESKRLENYLLEKVDRNKWGDLLCKILGDIENDFSNIIIYAENEIPWFDRIMNHVGPNNNDCLVLETVLNAILYLSESLGVTADENERLDSEVWKVRRFLKKMHPIAQEDEEESNEHGIGTITENEHATSTEKKPKKKGGGKLKPIESLIAIRNAEVYIGMLRDKIAKANNKDEVMRTLNHAVVNRQLSEWPSAEAYNLAFGDLVPIKESTYKYNRKKYPSFDESKNKK